jgi:hypothetical protein
MRLRSNVFVCLLVCFIVLSFAAAVEAAPSLSLSFYKDNGYGMGNEINGLWTVNTHVSQDISFVEFYVDDQSQLNDTSAPFSWSFNTINYTEGLHTIKVVAYNSLNETATAVAERNFVGFPWNFIAEIIGVVAVGFGVALVVSVYRIKQAAKKKKAQMG